MDRKAKPTHSRWTPPRPEDRGPLDRPGAESPATEIDDAEWAKTRTLLSHRALAMEHGRIVDDPEIMDRLERIFDSLRRRGYSLDAMQYMSRGLVRQAIAERARRDSRRSEIHRDIAHLPQRHDEPQSDVFRHDLVDILRDIMVEYLQEAPRLESQILEMRIFKSLTLKECADELGLTISAVHRRYKKAIAAIKGKLVDRVHDDPALRSALSLLMDE